MSDALETTLFQWLTTTTWQVGLLVVLVLSLQLVFRRALPPRWQLALWSVVALRLVIPSLPAVNGGVIQEDWAERVWSAADRGPGVDSETSPGLRAVEEVLEAAVAEGRGAVSDGPAQASPIRPAGKKAPPLSEGTARPGSPTPASNDLSEIYAVRDRAEVGGPQSPPSDGPAATTSAFESLAIKSWVVRGWLGIAAVLLVALVIFEIRFRRRIASAEVVTDPEIREELRVLREVSGVRREIDVRVVAGLGSPAVTGIFRPLLLLPVGALEEFTPEERRCVFLHELSHLRRNDVLWNGVLGVLQCVWWFHPLVHLAFSRLRQTRESARDFEALQLGAVARDRSVLYARTLLKLVEHRPDEPRLVPALGFLDGGSDLKRRIMMIADFPRQSPRRGVCVGLSVLALAGWAGFTQASPPVALVPSTPAGAAGQTSGSLKKIAVERQGNPPAWRAELEQRLDEARLADMHLPEVTVSEALQAISVISELSIVMTDSAREEMESEGHVLDMNLGDVTVREALDIITASHPELDWCLARETVAVGLTNDLPEAVDVRFYNIEPFFREFPEADYSDVLSIGRDLSSTCRGDLWDYDGRYIDYFNGLAVVQQTERGHAAFLEALELTLNRGRRPVSEPPAWRAKIADALSTRVQVSFNDMRVGEIAKWASELVKVPILFQDPDLREEEIDLQLGEVTLAAALDWVADRLGCRVIVVDGAIRFGETGGQETEFFEIADVARTQDGDEFGMVVDMIQNLIDPDSWDMDPNNSMDVWQEMLVVRQSPENIERIRVFLNSMRRALRAG